MWVSPLTWFPTPNLPIQNLCFCECLRSIDSQATHRQCKWSIWDEVSGDIHFGRKQKHYKLNREWRHSRRRSPSIPTIEKLGGGSARCMIAEIFLLLLAQVSVHTHVFFHFQLPLLSSALTWFSTQLLWIPGYSFFHYLSKRNSKIILHAVNGKTHFGRMGEGAFTSAGVSEGVSLIASNHREGHRRWSHFLPQRWWSPYLSALILFLSQGLVPNQ